ncbi:hypothetical protein Tco_0570539 [Tanacetum coccineum]
MIVLRIGDVKKNSDAPIPYAMLLTRLFKHMLKTNPQSIVPFDRFTYHECVMNPLDISRKTIRDKGIRAAPPSSSSSSSSNKDEETSSLQFYEELSDDEDLTNAQKEKRGMAFYGSQGSPIARDPYMGENTITTTKSLSPPHAPSKSTSSRSTYQTTSSSPSESPTPTHVAPPPKLRFVIPMKLEHQELHLQQTPPNDTRVLTVDNWPSGPSNPSPPPRVSHPPPGFEHPQPPPPFFVNINNNAPQLENLQNFPPNLGT